MKKMASLRLVTFKWLAVTLSFLIACFFSVIHGEAQAEDFMARHLGDYGNVTVMEVNGNYNEYNVDGTINAVPRQVIAKEFFRTHNDDYDFLVIFTNFDFTITSDTVAFYLQVKNDIRGIGLDIFDNSDLYGSAGKLQGTIDMGNIAKIASDPLSPDFEFTLETLSHEMLHRWGAYVKFKDQAGTISTALLGKDDAHWSFLLDTKGSLEYGNQWQDNGNGTFTSISARKYYSPLDLYLMGLIDKSQVPPMLLIENPSIDPKKMPEVGTTIAGTPRYITIDDIIAAEGERNPSSNEAPKQLKMAFIFVTSPGTFTGNELNGIENIRNGFLPRYSILTDGKGIVQVASTTKEDIPVNPGVLPPTTNSRVLPPSIDDGVKWLTTHQQTDGSWTDSALTVERDTAETITVLQLFPVAQPQFLAGFQWLGASGATSTDFLARQLEAIANGGGNSALLITQLLDRRNPDGGWGSGRGFISNPIDTALTLRALSRAAFSDQVIIDAGLTYLKGTQNSDGGWSGNGTVSAIQPTTEVVHVFNTYRKSYDLENQISLALAFLSGKQNADGGFGNSPSTVYDTAQSVLALLDAGGGSSAVTYAGLQYLRNSQSATGSWNESAYQTALAVKALLRDDTDLAPDLAFDSNAMTTLYPITSIPVNVTVRGIIRNLGRTNVPSATVVLYEGLNKVAEANISIAAQASATVIFPLNINDNQHHYYKMVIDPENTIKESDDYYNYIYIKVENNVQKPTVGFTQTLSSGAESVAVVKVPVSLNKPWFEPVTVAYSASIKSTASSPVDFTLNPGMLTFNPGETVKYIDISVVNNPSPGSNRTIVIDLYEPDIILYEIDRKAVITNSRHMYTILDSEPAPAVRIFSPVAGVTRENAPRLVYAADSGTVKVMVDGVVVETTSGSYLGTLSDGSHTVRVESTNGTNTGFAEVSFIVYTGTEAPYENIFTKNLYKTDPTAIDKLGNYYVVILNDGLQKLQKLDSSGKNLWLSVVPMSEVRNIVVDSEGSVYAVGYNYRNSYTSSTEDAVLVKYNSQGVQQWMKLFDSSCTDAAQGIAVDKNDNVYLAGMTSFYLFEYPFTSTTLDLFVVKLDKNGSEQWGRQLPVQNFGNFLLVQEFISQLPTGLAVDYDGNVYVSGPTDRAVGDTPYAGGIYDYFLYKFDTDGVVQWVRQGGTDQYDWVSGVAVDSLGGVYVVGDTNGGLDGNTNLGFSDAFVVKYDSSGTKLWTRQLGSSLNDTGHAIIAEKNGDFFVALDIDGHDVVTKYDMNGNQIWSKEIDHGLYNRIEGLLLGTNGDLYLSGRDYIDKLRDPRLPQVAFDKNTFQVNSRTASISGTMETDVLIAVELESGAFPGTVTYPTSGSWQCTLSGLVEGDNLVTVTAKNNLGFTGTATTTIKVDTVAPTVKITSPIEGQAYSQKPVLTFTVSEGTVKVKINGVEVNKVSGFPLDSLSAGFNYISVEATDEAGNRGIAHVTIFADGAAVGELPYGISWMRQFNINASDITDFVRDPSGNIYVTGNTGLSVDGISNHGSQDVFVLKFDNQGNKLGLGWLLGTASYEGNSRIAVDAAGNVYLAWQIGTWPAQEDIRVAKFGSSGNQLWIKSLGSTSTDELTGIAVDGAGNIFVTGNTFGSLDGNTSGGDDDFFVVKYNNSGVKQWTRQSGQTGSDSSSGITVDNDGNIYITGKTETGLNGQVANNSPFIVKYNPSGSEQLTRIIDSQSSGTGRRVVVDGANNIYIAGNADFETSVPLDIFLTKYDGTGSVLWTRHIIMSSAQGGVTGLTLDVAGNIFISGASEGVFDGNVYSGDFFDIFVEKFDSSGKKLWSTQLGSEQREYAIGATVDPQGNICLAGTTYNILDPSWTGNYSLFIMQLKQLLPDTTPLTVTIAPIASPTKSTVITLSGTVKAGATVAVLADTAAVVEAIAYPTTTTWSCTVSGLPEGTTHFNVKATDTTGLSTTVNTLVTRDSTPPEIQIVSPKGFVKNNSPILSYTLNEGVATVKLDDVVISKFSGSALGPLADGSHILHIDAMDATGNSSFAESLFTVDTVPPGVWINSVSTPTSVTNQALSGTMEIGSAITLSANTTASTGTVTYPTQTTWQCVVSNLAAGLNTFFVTATDQAGNISTATATVDYVADVTRPIISGFTVPSTSTSLTVPVSTFTATDNMGVTGYLITESNTPPTPGATGWTTTAPTSYTVATAGSHTLYPWAKDAVGNVSAVFATPRTVVITVSTMPDLIVTALTPPASAVTGQSVSVPVTVKNQGGVSAAGFNVTLYLCTVGTTSSCSVMNYQPISSLGAGAQQTITLTTTVPNVTAGTYYMQAYADAAHAISESNQFNNSLNGSPTTISYGPDLIVSAVTPPASAVTWQSISVPVTVKNQGAGSAPGFNVGLYLCPTSTISTDCTFLNNQSVSFLGAGAQQNFTLSATIPAVTDGTYYIGAIADTNNSVFESNETNNTLAGSPTTITVDAQAKSCTATSDASYILTEVPFAWEGTSANNGALHIGTHGDESLLSTLFFRQVTFYGFTDYYAVADTNGNVWYDAAVNKAAHSFDLANSGHRVIAAWNNDLSSAYSGGLVSEAHPTGIVWEWVTETKTDEGLGLLNNFEVVLLYDGSVRIDYKTMSPSVTNENLNLGSGISMGNGTAILDIVKNCNVTDVRKLSGRSFLFTPKPQALAQPASVNLTAASDTSSTSSTIKVATLDIATNDVNNPILAVPLSARLPLLAVAKAGDGSGIVTSDTGNISCGSTCSASGVGTTLTLTATPSAGSIFTGWSGGGCGGTGTCTVVMNNDATVYATFETILPWVTVNAMPNPINTPTATLSGAMKASSAVSVVANTTALTGTVTYPTQNTWQCSVSQLATGPNAFTITATNQAGSSSVTSSLTYVPPPVAITLSVQEIAGDFSGDLGITLNNVNPSRSEVFVEQFVDANRNGVIDAGDYVVRSFKVTDGIASANPDVQGDEDGTVDSTIRTPLHYFLTNDIYHAPGRYIFRATKGAEIATAVFTVNPVSQPQTISGMVTDGTNPIPGALVQLADKWQRHVAWAMADDSGSYVLNVRQPGDYNLLPIVYGYVVTATPVTLTASQNIVNQPLTLTAGTNHVTGFIKDYDSGAGIAGIWIQATDGNNNGIAITDSTGGYDILLPPGQYSVSVFAGSFGPAPFAKGYGVNTNQPLTIMVNGNLAVNDISLALGGIPVSGRVLDVTGNPVPDLVVSGELQAGAVNLGITDASGAYTLALGREKRWNISLDHNSAQAFGYIGTVYRDLTVSVPLSGKDLTVRPITAWIQGVVMDSANNLLPGVEVRLRNADSSITASAFTAADGTYRIGAYAESWYIDALTEARGTHPMTEQNVTLTDGHSARLDFVVDVTPPTLIINPVATPTEPWW